MTEVNYKTIKNHISDLNAKDKAGNPEQVYLIYGEELLCKSVLNELLDFLLPARKRGVGLHVFDGGNENIPDAIEQCNTYSLLGGTKVVCIHDSRVFYSREDTLKIFENAKTAYAKNEHQKAARYFLTMLGLSNIALEDLVGGDYNLLNIDSEHIGDTKWLDQLKAYCVDNRLSIPRASENSAILQKAVEKGFPSGNYLILTTDLVDKRRTLYKAIKATGAVIDCSVPRGALKADKTVQEAVVKERMNALLGRHHKKIDPAAFHAVYERTGFELRTFMHNLERLIDYVGKREKITIEDVRAVVNRTKKDPIYELTGAVAEKNLPQALFFMGSLLSEKFHPLQILAALTNQVRRLTIVKDFVAGPQGVNWRKAMTYNQFQAQVMPLIQAYDKTLSDCMAQWHTGPCASDKDGKGKKKAGPVSDLVIAKNPRSPYPVYLLLKNSEKFTLKALLDAMRYLSAADIKLKSTGQNPKLIMEDLLFKICR